MPREVHETYEFDPAHPDDREKDRLVGYTVVTRESPWDDKSRARAVALTEYEDNVCPCGCGLPREIAWKKQPFTVDHFVCYAGQSIEVLKQMHRDDPSKDSDTWFRGRHYFAVPVTEAAADN